MLRPMMTSSNGNIFRVTGPLCGEFTGPGEFPTQRPVTRSFDVYIDLRLNKRLCKQSRGWWFETLLCPLWRHSNAIWSVGMNFCRSIGTNPWPAYYFCIIQSIPINSRSSKPASSNYFAFTTRFKALLSLVVEAEFYLVICFLRLWMSSWEPLV